ncbi:MAG: hypothetical protein J6R13_03610 [Alistipes sp.]|nr:hypothetical protein [Alistipes sp.]
MRKIRNLAMMLLALFVAQGVVAQSRTSSVVVTDSMTIKTVVTRIPKFTPKHDIRVGVGTLSLPTILMLDEGDYYEDVDRNFADQMANADTYRTARRFIGNYTLTYTYQDRRWLQYGGTVAFGASTRKRKDIHTHKEIENLDRYMLSVMPTVRFSWFYRERVQLYSAVSVALVTDFDGLYLWGDATLFGCAFGRKFFGFAEFGVGMSGWCRAGIGYKFNAVKKQK